MPMKVIVFKENLSCLLAYILGPLAIVSGLFFFVSEEKNRLLRFHALQAVFFSVAWLVTLIILSLILLFSPRLMGIILSLVNVAGVVFWLLLMVRAYQAKFFLLPVIGKLALDNSAVEGEGGAEKSEERPSPAAKKGKTPRPARNRRKKS